MSVTLLVVVLAVAGLGLLVLIGVGIVLLLAARSPRPPGDVSAVQAPLDPPSSADAADRPVGP